MTTNATQQDFKDLPPFHVLIAAAGSGSRLGAEMPKQYLKIHGKPMLRYSIETFLSMPTCASLHVIIDPEDADLYHDAVQGLNLPNGIAGSDERNKSIFNGLKTIPKLKHDELVLIHDAARPCLHPQDIARLLNALQTERAASLASPISSTLRRASDNQNAGQQIPREDIWAMQTPQGFLFGDLLNAHENADPNHPITDDTGLVSAAGIPVKLVEGAPTNIKITHPQDLIMVEHLLTPNAKTLSGMGFDVHAFDISTAGPIRLCGINVAHKHALKGHSDADVALHALTDAILGAIGQGDIGRHFPPSDSTFKNMDSSIFLAKALELMKEQNATLNNIDMTIICETPKITPYADAMRTRLAKLTGLPESRINIKATTTEGLGFTGRKEGIAAQALASLTRPEETQA